MYKQNGREKVVYWSLDLPEAIQYAEMVNEFFPETSSAYVATCHGAVVWGAK